MANRVSINTDRSEEVCFGCGQKNPVGLRIKFHWDGKTVSAEFTPGEHFQGWVGVVHGGIIACILDEAMNHVGHFLGLSCLTARMEVKFKHPARIGEPLVINAALTRRTRKLIETKGRLSLRDGTVIAESTATQFIVEAKSGGDGSKESR